MDGLRLPSYGKEFQKDDGLSRSLDSGSDPHWIEVCHPTGGGVVTWTRTAALNFQLRSGHPHKRWSSATSTTCSMGERSSFLTIYFTRIVPFTGQRETLKESPAFAASYRVGTSLSLNSPQKCMTSSSRAIEWSCALRIA